MLEQREALATVGVRDLGVAKQFYEEMLGLTPLESGDSETMRFRAGSSTLLVYRSQFAGTNKATAVTWFVGADVDTLVGDLGKKGVRFEHYDMPGLTREGDIHVAGDMRVAWFKDPDGNIHSLVNR